MTCSLFPAMVRFTSTAPTRSRYQLSTRTTSHTLPVRTRIYLFLDLKIVLTIFFDLLFSDLTIMRQGLKFARQLGSTPPLSNHLTGELNPGSSVSTDQDWETWLAGTIGTEYHPSGSCAMLPLDQGGVVDANLRVYGLGE